MNQPVSAQLQVSALWQQLAALVRIGLVRFWRQALPADTGLLGLLQQEAQELVPHEVELSWELMLASVQHRWPHLFQRKEAHLPQKDTFSSQIAPNSQQEALARLIQDQNLSLVEGFLLTLLGEVERSHLINLVIAELQSPERQPRPTVHFCTALIDALFGAGSLSPLQLPESPLVQAHLIHLEGEGPLPLKNLRATPGYWSVLLDQARAWPGCQLINEKADFWLERTIKSTELGQIVSSHANSASTEMHHSDIKKNPQRSNEDAQLLPQNPKNVDGNRVSLLPDALLQQIPTLATVLESGGARGLILRGHPNSGRKLVAQTLAAQMQQRALLISLELWQKDPGLALVCRYARWLPVLQPNLGPGEVWRPGALSSEIPFVVMLGTDGAVEISNLLELAMPLPNQAQRTLLWTAALAELDGAIATAADQVIPAQTRLMANPQAMVRKQRVPKPANQSKQAQQNSPYSKTLSTNPIEDHHSLAQQCASNALLSGPTILSIATHARLLAKRNTEPLSVCHIKQARRQLGAERLRLLAQPVERDVDTEAIVLPPLVNAELDRLIARARQRESLWNGLGATLQQTSTGGLRALFTGDSGTGKTLAASYVATRLGAPLYRVDLSAVMNKYIGESEKNLSVLLDMAAASDVVLLFDEADSLFGRRTEGKETGERFANMLTHFLLTRIENHPGIVILTSNNRERIDAAFTRRLDLIVEFPQPGFEERLRLWRSHLGERGPGEAAYRLIASYCNFAGGQLRNVVLTAAACAGNAEISCEHLLIGLQAEYRKIGREMPLKLGQLGLIHSKDKTDA